jgi:hypothetical protein
MRWLAVVHGCTGRLEPYRGAAGIVIEFNAPNREAAIRLAAANRLPPTVSIIPLTEYADLRRSSNAASGSSSEDARPRHTTEKR